MANIGLHSCWITSDNNWLFDVVCIHVFIEFFENSSLILPDKLAPLRQAVDRLLVSTAECQRSFSTMNDIAINIHSMFSIQRISALMFAEMIGPKNVTAFNTESYVGKWLDAGRPSEDETDSRQRDPGKQQQQQQ